MLNRGSFSVNISGDFQNSTLSNSQDEEKGVDTHLIVEQKLKNKGTWMEQKTIAVQLDRKVMS